MKKLILLFASLFGFELALAQEDYKTRNYKLNKGYSVGTTVFNFNVVNDTTETKKNRTLLKNRKFHKSNKKSELVYTKEKQVFDYKKRNRKLNKNIF
jgi:hypothetical protein